MELHGYSLVAAEPHFDNECDLSDGGQFESDLHGNPIGADTVAAAGDGASQAFTVYGSVPAQSTPAPAIYNDTITVTVTY